MMHFIFKINTEKEQHIKKQFDLLSTLKGELVENAIAWIKDCYDCYYKNDFENEEGTAFEYLRSICKTYEGE